jgi:hypothetical protein
MMARRDRIGLVAREALALIGHEFLSNLILDFQKFLLPLKLPGPQNALFLAFFALGADRLRLSTRVIGSYLQIGGTQAYVASA